MQLLQMSWSVNLLTSFYNYVGYGHYRVLVDSKIEELSGGEEESGGGDSEYGCTRGTYLDSCIVFSESTLLCFNKCLIDYPTSLCRRKC